MDTDFFSSHCHILYEQSTIADFAASLYENLNYDLQQGSDDNARNKNNLYKRHI